MLEPVKNKIKEKYQEYDRFIVYDIYSVDKNGNKKFLYRKTESKIRDKRLYEIEQDRRKISKGADLCKL